MPAPHQRSAHRFLATLDQAQLDRAEFGRLSGFTESAVDSWAQGWRRPPPVVWSWLSLYQSYKRYKALANGAG